MDGVFVNPGYMRLEDFCNSKEHGAGLLITASICTEEIEEPELGLRVVNTLVEQATTGWDPLMDALMAEMEANA